MLLFIDIINFVFIFPVLISTMWLLSANYLGVLGQIENFWKRDGDAWYFSISITKQLIRNIINYIFALVFITDIWVIESQENWKLKRTQRWVSTFFWIYQITSHFFFVVFSAIEKTLKIQLGFDCLEFLIKSFKKLYGKL